MSFPAVSNPNITRSNLRNITPPRKYHLAFDGYVMDRDKMMDQSLLENLLSNVNRFVFDGAGIVRINSIDGAQVSDWMDHGLLGYIVNAGEHFAIRVSPNRGMIIADLCTREECPRSAVINLLLKAYRPWHHSLCRDATPPRNPYGKHMAFISQVPVDYSRAQNVLSVIKSDLKVHQIGEDVVIEPIKGGNENDYDIFVPLREGFIAMHPYSFGTVLMLLLRNSFDVSFLRRVFSADECYSIPHAMPEGPDVSTGFVPDELARAQRRSNKECGAGSSKSRSNPNIAMGGGVK